MRLKHRILCLMICWLAMGVEGLAQTFTLQQFQQLVWEQATRMPSYYSLQTAEPKAARWSVPSHK
ncbi:MAG: hypothetical protein R3C61_03845 [Bacteroidia bacterium]